MTTRSLSGLLIFLLGASLPFPVTALLQTASAAIQPYHFWALLLIGLTALTCSTAGKMFIGGTTTTRNAFLLFSLFTVTGIVGAAVLPYLFEGVRVYAPRISIDDQYKSPGVLGFSISNLASIVYLIINWGVYVCMLQLSRGSLLGLIVNRSLVIAGVLGCGSVLIDAASSYLGLPELPFDFIKNNQAHMEALQGTTFVGEATRASGLFSESSEAGAFSAVMMAFYLTRWKMRRSTSSLLLAAMAAAGAIFSLSSTGFIGVGVALICVFFLSTALIEQKKASELMVFNRDIALFALIALVISLILGSSTILENAFNQLIANKANDLSYLHRAAADQFALGLIPDTYGLGVGMGSNRPSSFATSMLSCTGGPGTLIFLMLIAYLFRVTKQIGKHGGAIDVSQQLAIAVPVLNAAITTIVLYCVSIPDLTTPLMWFLVSASLALGASGTAPSVARGTWA